MTLSQSPGLPGRSLKGVDRSAVQWSLSRRSLKGVGGSLATEIKKSAIGGLFCFFCVVRIYQISELGQIRALAVRLNYPYIILASL